GQFRGIRLLPLRSDRVIHGILLPNAAFTAGCKIVTVLVDPHASYDVSGAIFKLTLGEISDDVLRTERTKHTRLPRVLPCGVFARMTTPACVRTGVFRGRRRGRPGIRRR